MTMYVSWIISMVLVLIEADRPYRTPLQIKVGLFDTSDIVSGKEIAVVHFTPYRNSCSEFTVFYFQILK